MSMRIKSSEITPEHIYISRRNFMKGVSISAASALLLAACGPQQSSAPASSGSQAAGGPVASGSAPATAGPLATAAAQVTAGTTSLPTTASSKKVEVPDEPLTSFEDVTNFNNFYEFTTNKEGVARLAKDFKAVPWTVAVGGMVNKPMTFGIEDLVKKFAQEERVYRMRCVEGWSMVIPWLGFSLAALLKEVEPLSDAKYVRFETLVDPLQMPGQRDKTYPWPYIEGLRLDEAMNDLTILSTGLYGKSLLPQNGAPVRLVVPWKYGFKSIKSIVKIDLVDKEPKSLWMKLSPDEYGFYANVNPEVSHPRWSQASERRIGEAGRRRTLPFNGYAEQVAQLYTGMDLRKNY
ncbi:MAG: protein-methionine-sulfoxide reductase catalytic subunit MsrP [Anaerolineae bacterium]|nr:protein-methionine-sulfoxide reductase catalytic subunit MsrP [Anaerolineae bacterium]